MLATLVRIATDDPPHPEARDTAIRRLVDDYGGELIAPVGDACLASFDGPSRAVGCALALRDTIAKRQIEVRIVAHIGEIKRRGTDVSGVAVDRIESMGSLAAVGDVLISRTLADLVAGSEFVCTEAGEYLVAGAPPNLGGCLRWHRGVRRRARPNQRNHDAKPECSAVRVTPGWLASGVRPHACTPARA